MLLCDLRKCPLSSSTRPSQSTTSWPRVQNSRAESGFGVASTETELHTWLDRSVLCTVHCCTCWLWLTAAVARQGFSYAIVQEMEARHRDEQSEA